MAGESNIELDRPRSVGEMLGTAFELYLRVPILFIALAAVVVIPWEVILLLITGDGPLAISRTGFLESNLITALGSFLVTPLISALHVHAVREVGEGERPRFFPTFRQSLATLPVVVLATGISWVAITVGTVVVVPGLMLWARWAVVAQTATMENGSWTAALRRSADLTEGHRWHALGLLFAAVLISLVPSFALAGIFGHKTTTVASFAAGTALQVVVRSFEALTVALLYFDLKARVGTGPAVPTSAGRPIGHPSDPRNYSDEDRPGGWYIDPAAPGLMHYWIGEGERRWSESTTSTPKKTLLEWRELAKGTAETSPTAQLPPPVGHPLDPASYTDEDRPPGWYVIPDAPWSMRYWAADGEGEWSKRKAKTPKDVREGWRDTRWTRGAGDGSGA